MLFVIALLCAIAVVVALIWRLVAAARDVPRAERVGLIMTAVHDRVGRNGRNAGATRDTASTRDTARHARDRTSTR